MAATALQVISLIEALEPEMQTSVVSLINVWHNGNADVKATLQGEVTALQAIVDKARKAQGLPPDPTPIADPDPSTSTPPSAPAA